jgi:hypothetical protein
VSRRILVLGGYGVFGSGVAARLAADGFEVVVAGRDLEKARAACAGRPGLTPARVDRDHDFDEAVTALRPWLVVDAAGPFQSLDYAAPRACVAAGVHYVDLADGRDYVAGVGVLDTAARDAGVAVVSGASSVPALSSAVVRKLAEGLDAVTAVEMSISASSRATVGRSVARAILSTVGRPQALWRGRRWERRRGWSEVERRTYRVTGRPALGPRLIAAADVPDLALLPDRLPGRPAVDFKAGGEIGWQNRAVQALGWAVRLGWLPDASVLTGLIERVRRLSRGLGGDRSAMTVAVYGWRGGRRLERRWTLIAEAGCGPQLPTLAAPLVSRAIRDGQVGPGAQDAGGLLSLEAFERDFTGLPVFHEVVEADHGPPLYARVMGARFAALPPKVQAMHAVWRDGGAAGTAQVERGTHPLAPLIAGLFGFPPAGSDTPVHVAFHEDERGMIWRRTFGAGSFASRVTEDGGQLVERFGPLRFAFALDSEVAGLAMRLTGWALGPLRLPLALGPSGLAREWEADGRFHFDVPIRLPLVGLLVRYRGVLDPL